MRVAEKILLLLGGLFVISAAAAQPDMPQTQIVAEINRAAAEMRALECDFVQTKHISLMNEKMVSTGRMYYRQSDRLRWEYLSPYAYIFILNGSNVTLKSEKRTDVIDIESNRIFSEIARIMMNSVTGRSLTDTSDFKAAITASGDEWIAELTPQKKELKQMFRTVVLHFDRKSEVVREIELIERSGDKTVIELKNIKKNQTVDEKVFVVG